MRLCLVEDLAVSGLEPLSLTRPIFDLLPGATTLGAKVARAFRAGGARRGAVVRSHLECVLHQRDPQLAVNDPSWLARGPVVVANGRWVPPACLDTPSDAEPWLGLCDGRPACALVGPGEAARLTPRSVDGWFEALTGRLRGRELSGEWVSRPWDLVAKNAAHVERDFAAAGQAGVSNRHLATAALVGPVDRLFIHESARVDPYTVFDTTNGPITVAAGAWVQPFTRVEGPSYVGRDTHLFR